MISLRFRHVAYLGPVLATACSAWFNVSYVQTQATSDYERYGLTAFAIAIALCNCSFLAIAASQWHERLRVRSVVLATLWLVAFTFSMSTAFAYMMTTRDHATGGRAAEVEQRQRVQREFERLTEAIATAKKSSLWEKSASCLAPTTKDQRSFCANLQSTEMKLDEAGNVLNRIRPGKANPEIQVIAEITGFPFDHVQSAFALFPALAVELIAALGFYSLRRTTVDANAPGKPIETREHSPQVGERKPTRAASQVNSGALAKGSPTPPPFKLRLPIPPASPTSSA